MFFSVSFHEFGHASATKYFGARHGGIGGGFYLFTPVYFADVTDIWRLPKSKRIVVNLAGVYFELIFVTIISLIGLIANSKLVMMLSFTILMQAFANFNPLIRSDGYWILSDAIGTPNLMNHATNRIKKLLNFSFFHIKKSWILNDYLLLCYGISSYIFIGIFLYYLLIENPDSLLYFPIDLYNFLKKMLDKRGVFSISEYGKLIPAAIFYLLFFRFLYGLLKKIKSRVVLHL